MSIRVGIVLSGCGVFDGAEVHESVLTLLHVVKAGADVTFLAPDVAQAHVINHLVGQPVTGEQRNVRVEAARIARGDVQDIALAKADDFDAVIFPGGFGAAKNLGNLAFAKSPDEMTVEAGTRKLVEAMYASGKPLGFICIAPASVAAVALKGKGLKLTVGSNDDDAAGAVRAMGHTHVAAKVDEIVIDNAHNIVSTPAYMLAKDVAEADSGIAKLVAEIMVRAKSGTRAQAANA
ncbi:MAG: isoprenoid biosynthesis glyoxalase ElbB [Proteobacteria bacterium]|nr:isoprenoid biosynthesis glyoxalase ElbB [Pseudomonadota bacterium]